MLSKKEQLILEHYKHLIESQSFDEFDLIGLFIFIRSIIQKGSYANIYDICDTIAHRERDQGKATTGIKKIIQNHYRTKSHNEIHSLGNSQKLQGANGINEETWKKEWKKFGKNYNIKINDSIIQDISLCVLSLLQDVQLQDDQYTSIASLKIVKAQNELSVAITEGRAESPFVVFFKVCAATEPFPDGPIDDAIYTIRENGKLKLLTDNHMIIV
ncbi:hypothetical protein JRC49_03400 [Clostridiales bacterium FE2011]|nr:hypothetical protein JRC49_03400 [Clostridiales bacterium FE2011]